jgi:plastocyanin
MVNHTHQPAISDLAKRIAVVAMMGIALGACLMAEAAQNSSGTPSPSPAASPSPVGSPSPISLAGHGSATVSHDVTIQLTDEGYVPNYVQSTSGHDLNVTLVNTGSRRHGFTIAELGVDVMLDPGQTKTLVVHPVGLGDYTYVSTAPGDDGMTGTLTFYI